MMDYYELACELLGMRSSRPQICFDQTVSKLMKAEVFVLNYLQEHQSTEADVHPKNLSDGLVVSTARIAVILNHLEEKGLVYRVPDEHDNRQTIVRLSDRGQVILENSRQKLLEYMEKILQRMGEEDAKEYVRLQQKFVRALAES